MRQILAVPLLLMLTLSACTSAVGDGAGVPTGSTSPDPDLIVVTVKLPSGRGTLVGPATGRVLDSNGVQVAEFEFESGWILPDNWSGSPDPPQPSQAPRELVIELTDPDSYTFELDDFAVSGSPCGTCERGYSGGSVIVSVDDGTVVALPFGESTWES